MLAKVPKKPVQTSEDILVQQIKDKGMFKALPLKRSILGSRPSEIREQESTYKRAKTESYKKIHGSKTAMKSWVI